MRRTYPFYLGLACGLLLTAAAAHAEPLPDTDLASLAWPSLSAQERALVEVVAAETYEQHERGWKPRYDALPEPRKAALRGGAMRRLGYDAEAARRGWI